jgi:hypothetical protein
MGLKFLLNKSLFVIPHLMRNPGVSCAKSNKEVELGCLINSMKFAQPMPEDSAFTQKF